MVGDQRLTNPADAFQVGDRIRFDGENATVTERFYLDDRRSISLGIRPDSGGPGDRWIFESRERVEVADPPPFRIRLRSALKNKLQG